MNIISLNTARMRIHTLDIAHLDVSNFADSFHTTWQAHFDGQRTAPVFVRLTAAQSDALTIPKLSMLIDSLKDYGVIVSGLVSDNPALTQFAEHIGVHGLDSAAFAELSAPTPEPQQKPATDNEAATLNKAPSKEPAAAITTKAAANALHTAQQAQPKSAEPAKTEPAKEVAKTPEPAAPTPSAASEMTNRTLGKTPDSAPEKAPTQGSETPNAPTEPTRPEGRVTAPAFAPKEETKPEPPPVPNPYQFANNSPEQTKPSPPTAPAPAASAPTAKAPAKPRIGTITKPIPLGKKVEFDGDLILLAPLERTSVVSATGSIHCYDRVEGTLIAGAKGDKNANIFVHRLHAEAIAIAGFYAKYDQYKDIDRSLPLMISLKNNALNFSGASRATEATSEPAASAATEPAAGLASNAASSQSHDAKVSEAPETPKQAVPPQSAEEDAFALLDNADAAARESEALGDEDYKKILSQDPAPPIGFTVPSTAVPLAAPTLTSDTNAPMPPFQRPA